MAIGIGRTAGWCAVGVLILGHSLLADPTSERPIVRATLDVVLQHREISKLTASVMREEAERIWMREGVQIRWRASDADVPPDASFIRLELVDEYAAAVAERSATALGDFQARVGTIRVSLRSAAQTTALGLSGYRKPLQPFDHPLALGYVLGRAVAHEIGHSLLGARHAETGLMQAAFTPGQMVDRLSGSFSLTPVDSARLYHRLDDGRITLRVRAPERRAVDLALDNDDELAR
jgi:hypothetical protein